MKISTHFPLLMAASLAASASAAPLLQIKEDVALQFVGSSSVEYSDNIFFTKSNKEDAVKFAATPGLRLNLGDAISDAYAVISTQEELTAYTSGHTNLNNQLNTTKAQGVYDNGKLRLTAGAGIAETDQNSPDLARNGTLVERSTTSYNLTAAYKFNEKISGSTGFDYAETSYENNPTLPFGSLRDNNSWSVPLNVFYAINPNLDASVGFRHRETKVDSVLSAGDSKDNYYNVGLRGVINPKLTASFNTGIQVRSYENNQSDTTSFAAQGRITYTVNAKSQVDFDLDTDMDIGGSGSSIKRTGGQVSYSNQLTRDWTASGFLGYRILDYVGSFNDRKDDNLVTGVNVRYSINRYASLSGRYTLQNNSSSTNNGSDIDYTANIFTLTLDFVY